MRFLKKFRINFFDVLVVLLLVLVLGSLLYLRTSKKTQWITVRLVAANDEWWFEGSPPQWWYVDNLVVGQTMRNAVGGTTAKIVGLEIFDIGAYKRRAFIDIQLQGSYDTKRQMYLYNYQPIQIGKALDLTFGKNNVHGIITYINELPSYTSKTIEVRIAAIRPWVAQTYKPGLIMKDSQGKPLAEILAVSVYQSQVSEVTEESQRSLKKYQGSLYVDATLQLRIQTFQSGGVDYFVDRAAIKVGEQISFQFPQTIAREAEIIRIVE